MKEMDNICNNCKRRKGNHYGTLCFCYQGDKDGKQDKFVESTETTGESK